MAAVKEESPDMYQPIHFKNITTHLALAILIILRANTCFAQVSYSTFNYPGAAGDSTFLTGVQGAGGGNVYITGTYEQQGSTDTQGLLYQGLFEWRRPMDDPEFSWRRYHRHGALWAGQPRS